MTQQSLGSSPDGLKRLLAVREEATEAVTNRFSMNDHAGLDTLVGARGLGPCKAEIGYHLDFIGSALEFGNVDLFVNYLRWIATVLRSRNIPDEHLVLSLDYLEEAVEAHLSEADAAALASLVASAKGALLDEDQATTAESAATPDAWEECDAFYDAIVSGDGQSSLEIFRQAIAAGRGFVQTSVHLVQPTFYRIGDGWQKNRVSVAQEHLATVIAHSMLAREFVYAAPKPRANRKAVFACVEGNQHALGLQMVADAFELEGWEVRNVGADTPTAALVGFVRQDQPHLVGLSAAMPHHLPSAKAAIAQLRSDLGDACPKVMLGGLAINDFEPLSKMLGADCTAGDARAAPDAAGACVR